MSRKAGGVRQRADWRHNPFRWVGLGFFAIATVGLALDLAHLNPIGTVVLWVGIVVSVAANGILAPLWAYRRRTDK